MKTSATLLLLVFFILPWNSIAQPIEWPVSEGGNGHYYEFVPDSGELAIWWDDNHSAMSKIHEGFRGHLATLTSSEENNWVVQNVLVAGQVTAQVIYLGGWTDRFLGPTDTWHWITGEEWSYTNWCSPSEPSRGVEEYALCYLHEYDSGGIYRNGWNDLQFLYGIPLTRTAGHLVEYDNFPVVDMPPVGGPVGNESKTWGSVKALFR